LCSWSDVLILAKGGSSLIGTASEVGWKMALWVVRLLPDTLPLRNGTATGTTWTAIVLERKLLRSNHQYEKLFINNS
jgi:hypothetical protein